MHETEQEILDFKKLLGQSAHNASPNLRKALQMPDKMLKAEQIIRHLQGLHTFAFAASTTDGSPQITLNKALFYRTNFYIPGVRTSLRTRQIMHRPNVSLAKYEGDDFALIINGVATIVDPQEDEFKEEIKYVDEVHRMYASEVPSDSKNGIYIRVRPVHFYSYASDPKAYPSHA